MLGPVLECGCLMTLMSPNLHAVDDVGVVAVWECASCGATQGMTEGLDEETLRGLRDNLDAIKAMAGHLP